jgi:hypothetical protein
MPLPSSTAFSTSTGCLGLTVEQVLIAASCAAAAGSSALTGDRMSPSDANTAPVLRELLFL